MVHLLEITLYAGTYYYLTDTLGLGTFSGNFTDAFSNYLYYSAETFSSLGFGDIVPRRDRLGLTNDQREEMSE